MKGYTLARMMKSDLRVKQLFRGIYSRDRLPKHVVLKPSIYIINTDHSRGAGLHWVCVYIGSNNIAEYWDSFGLDIQNYEIWKFINDNSSRYIYNDSVLQPVFSETCGYYCLYYAMKKSRGVSMQNITKHFRRLKPYYNDYIVTRHFTKKYF